MIQRMKVVKRDNTFQTLSFDKIKYRLKKLVVTKPILKYVDIDIITMETIKNIYDNIKTSELDEISARISLSLSCDNPEYTIMASRIIISNMHKNTTECFSEVMEVAFSNKNDIEEAHSLISEELISIIRENKNELNFHIKYDLDYLYDYFGYKTLEKSYLLKQYLGNKQYRIIERPQHLLMRVALGIHKSNIKAVLQSYDLMSNHYFTHATPTLYNSGTNKPQMSSCFLLSIEDSMKGIYKCISDCAEISKNAGGIGVAISDIRGKGAYIKGTNGRSDGIVKMLKVFNETARFANQGSKRNGSFAIYLEPWHTDIEEFLELRLPSGADHERARDLFYALWINDIFMEAVESDSDWYLMNSNKCPGLTDSYGEAFKVLYFNYVAHKKYDKVIKARSIWNKILVSQIETGMPYMSYKDSVNAKSNQKNIGIIKSSNLCNEITLHTNKNEIAVCNIATFSLPKYLEKDNKGRHTYNHQKLYDIVKVVTRNMNNVIDYNFYPTPETEFSNKSHRPIALGIQGLHTLFFEIGIAFESNEAQQLNKEIMETIQYAGWTASAEIAQEKSKTYSSYKGSPVSSGLFQHNLWGLEDSELSGRWNWETLRNFIKEHGVYNSMITALPPTASTSQLLCNYESFEPQNSNMYMRSTSTGDFPIINKYLISDLLKLGLWNDKMKNKIMYHNGSVANISEIPDNIKQIYKTRWEIPQKTLINMSADRGLFVDQSQSLNIFMDKPTGEKLTSMHFYGWKKGLKTGMYYLRSKPAINAQQFSIDKKIQQEIENEVIACPMNNNTTNECAACSG